MTAVALGTLSSVMITATSVPLSDCPTGACEQMNPMIDEKLQEIDRYVFGFADLTYLTEQHLEFKHSELI